MAGPPLQLRLGFSAPGPVGGLDVRLEIAGEHVALSETDGRVDDLKSALALGGVHAELAGENTLLSPMRNIGDIAAALSTSTWSLSEGCELLWKLAHSGPGVVATLDEYDAALSLSWFANGTHHEHRLQAEWLPALVASGLAFVATQHAWESVAEHSPEMAVLVGEAQMNLDGFIEITTSLPQLVEGAPLPALFRLDDTHFGVPAAYAASIDAASGFVWSGQRPVPSRAPAAVSPFELTPAAAGDLQSLVDGLSASHAQVVAWPSGTGRRVFTLAALDSMDAWPLLVVCRPQAVWVWQRHLDLMGHKSSLLHDRADVRIVTYHDLARGVRLSSPAAIVLDDIDDRRSRTPAVRAALRRLDGLTGGHRVGLCSQWPTDSAEAVDILSALRPCEFPTSVPLERRYPLNPTRRLAEHTAVYLAPRDTSESAPDSFPRSRVLTVAAAPSQLRAISGIAELFESGELTDAEALSEALDVVSNGTGTSVSPKVAACAELARAAVRSGRRVVVLTRHVRTASLLRAALRPLAAHVVEHGGDPRTGDVVVYLYGREIGELRWADEVLVCDLPWNTAALDLAAGAAGSEGVPDIICVHLDITIEDRVAMLAARRRESSPLDGALEPPGPGELPWLSSNTV